MGGCAAPNADGIYDPFEGVNRTVFDFNHTLDNRAALPAATYYKSALPDDVRAGVHNFLANLSVPVDFANDVLQGEFTQAGYAVCRVSVNTTAGILGVLDPAAGMGCPDRDEDFGQTLGVYGVPGGPYLVLPLLGSSLPRDVAGKVLVDHYFNPLAYLQYRGKFYVGLGQNVIKVVDQRSHAVAALREVERNSIDYYASMRRLYIERRNAAIRNDPPESLTTPAIAALTPPADKSVPANTPAAQSDTPAAVPGASNPAPLAPDAPRQ
jgi:phospholipid-binding lipoprotein MlaA